MIAPVYRNIETSSTLFGLAFPLEVLILMGVFWAAIFTLPTKYALLVVAATYAFLRLFGRRRPPQYLQHLVAFHTRRLLHGATLSGTCPRRRVPAFPFGRYLFRDLPLEHADPALLAGLPRSEPHAAPAPAPSADRGTP